MTTIHFDITVNASAVMIKQLTDGFLLSKKDGKYVIETIVGGVKGDELPHRHCDISVTVGNRDKRKG